MRATQAAGPLQRVVQPASAVDAPGGLAAAPDGREGLAAGPDERGGTAAEPDGPGGSAAGPDAPGVTVAGTDGRKGPAAAGDAPGGLAPGPGAKAGPMPQARTDVAETAGACAPEGWRTPRGTALMQDQANRAGRRAAPDPADLWGEPEEAPAPPPGAGAGEDRAAGALLLACADEAGRLAAQLAAVDAQVAAALADPATGRPSGEAGRATAPAARPASALAAALQGVDLLRQESAGLAQVLALIVEHGQCAGRVPAAALAGATPLAAQRIRLQGPAHFDGPGD